MCLPFKMGNTIRPTIAPSFPHALLLLHPSVLVLFSAPFAFLCFAVLSMPTISHAPCCDPWRLHCLSLSLFDPCNITTFLLYFPQCGSARVLFHGLCCRAHRESFLWIFFYHNCASGSRHGFAQHPRPLLSFTVCSGACRIEFLCRDHNLGEAVCCLILSFHC